MIYISFVGLAKTPCYLNLVICIYNEMLLQESSSCLVQKHSATDLSKLLVLHTNIHEDKQTKKAIFNELLDKQHLTSLNKLHPNIGICKPHRGHYMMICKNTKTSKKERLDGFLYQITFISIIVQFSKFNNVKCTFCFL